MGIYDEQQDEEKKRVAKEVEEAAEKAARNLGVALGQVLYPLNNSSALTTKELELTIEKNLNNNATEKTKNAENKTPESENIKNKEKTEEDKKKEEYEQRRTNLNYYQRKVDDESPNPDGYISPDEEKLAEQYQQQDVEAGQEFAQEMFSIGVKGYHPSKSSSYSLKSSDVMGPKQQDISLKPLNDEDKKAMSSDPKPGHTGPEIPEMFKNLMGVSVTKEESMNNSTITVTLPKNLTIEKH